MFNKKVYLIASTILSTLALTSYSALANSPVPFPLDSTGSYPKNAALVGVGSVFGTAQDGATTYAECDGALVAFGPKETKVIQYPWGPAHLPYNMVTNWTRPMNMAARNGYVTVPIAIQSSDNGQPSYTEKLYMFHDGKWSLIVQAPKNQEINAQVFAPNGALDLAIGNTVYQYQNGRLTRFAQMPDMIGTIAWINGSLIAGSASNSTVNHLYQLGHNAWVRYPYAFYSQSKDYSGLETIAYHNGMIAVSSGFDHWQYSKGKWSKLPWVDSKEGWWINNLTYTPSGVLTAASYGGVWQFVNNQWVQLTIPKVEGGGGVSNVITLPNGDLIVDPQDVGLWKYSQGQWQSYNTNGTPVLIGWLTSPSDYNGYGYATNNSLSVEMASSANFRDAYYYTYSSPSGWNQVDLSSLPKNQNSSTQSDMPMSSPWKSAKWKTGEYFHELTYTTVGDHTYVLDWDMVWVINS